jgi:aromatic ring-opening dioxygenase catalytic subunit (LigB family)
LSEHPGLIYDYSGFPEESYNLKYPCSGSPKLAEIVHHCLGHKGIYSELDANRGFDHGVFVPMKIMYPNADIPCVQLSLNHSLDPEEHIRIGSSLGHLHESDILVIGSGFSFHNLQAFFGQRSEDHKALNEGFEGWLQNLCISKTIPEKERRRELVEWSRAPGAKYCHPREEHLLPLHVCYGVSESSCSSSSLIEIMGVKTSMYI